MPVAYCPRCSTDIPFADDASDDAVGRCTECTVSITLGAYKELEWANAFSERIKDVDWAALPNGLGRHDVEFRYKLAFELARVGSNPADAIPFVESALFENGVALPIAARAKPFIEEIVKRHEGHVPAVENLLARLR